MERMGILPNSVLTGQTQPALARKREKEEESRKERDKDVISKGRAIVERRRAEMAQERAAKGIVDPVASNLPNPSSEKKITANLANDGARVEPPSMSATLEKAREEARAETEAQKVEGDIEVVKHKMSDQSSTFGREETFARTNAEPELIKTATINSAKKTSRKVPLKAETRKPVEEFNNKPLVTDGEMLAAIIVEIQPDDVGIVSTNFGGATPISIHEFGPGAVTREKAPSPSLPPLADVVKNQTPQKARRAKRSSNAPAPTLQSPKLEKKEVSKKHGMNVEPIAREKSKTRRTRTPKTITEVLEEEDLLPELQAILSKRWFPSLEVSIEQERL
ncbi:hypothetical protein DFS34DRAFT_511685 [Phlyctochytrium arcticum]|nr:hypothetical protein DFS34DRAFT_511685 [Phlyctochytrium arcticum]